MKRVSIPLLLVALAACGSGEPPAGVNDGGVTGATCLPAPAAGSILSTCEAGNRACVTESSTAAHCGACKPTFTEVGGQCQASMDCATLNCGAQHRDCDPNPNGHCTACSMGFVEEAGACRAAKTCADLTCDPGKTCVANPNGDAECRALAVCGQNQAPKADGSGCVTCQINCGARLGGTGMIYSTVTTLGDLCICETQPGFFWDDGAPGGGDIRPCDRDRDGWVRDTARKYIDGQDVALHENARCTVRTIDKFRLVNDALQSLDVTLPTPKALYEPERNDDQGLLDDEVVQGHLPRYGRNLKAEELNALTKACVNRRTREEHADFNLNNVEDVDEGHDDPAFMDTPGNPQGSFSNFAYFIEAYRGWYEAPANGELYGAYVIREKSRSTSEPDPGLLLPLVQDPAEGDEYWRLCVRARDPDYMPAKAGFDFAKYTTVTSSTVFGFGHHSQFRCLRVVSQASANPQEVTVTAAQEQWTLNQCEAQATHAPVGNGLNPSDPELVCQRLMAIPDPRTSTTPPVVWGIARYLPEDDSFNQYSAGHAPRGKQPAYTRGCINECARFPFNCPGYDPDPTANRAVCTGLVNGFGRLACGCAKGAGGTQCEIGCAGDLSSGADGYLFTPMDYDPVSREGYWLCGHPSTTVEDPTDGNYTVRGEVPSAVTPSAPLCEIDTGSGCSGFSISAYTH
ncbi:MAG: hypothetical protein U1E65_21420 [Myxococcota bacterium]